MVFYRRPSHKLISPKTLYHLIGDVRDNFSTIRRISKHRYHATHRRLRIIKKRESMGGNEGIQCFRSWQMGV
jgi:hypothetical protein